MILDIARVYAMAAIGIAVSLRAKSAARAVFWSLLWGLLLLACAVGAELGGAYLTVSALGPPGAVLGCVILLSAAILLEAGVGYVLLPWLILRWASRRSEVWLARAE